MHRSVRTNKKHSYVKKYCNISVLSVKVLSYNLSYGCILFVCAGDVSNFENTERNMSQFRILHTCDSQQPQVFYTGMRKLDRALQLLANFKSPSPPNTNTNPHEAAIFFARRRSRLLDCRFVSPERSCTLRADCAQAISRAQILPVGMWL
jgi:hypothetical protein